MMLDAVETGRGVGMPIPIGYDDLNVSFYCIFSCFRHPSGYFLIGN